MTLFKNRGTFSINLILYYYRATQKKEEYSKRVATVRVLRTADLCFLVSTNR
jgi:hypothetical protein